jgi:glycosyltransferase involved in cell wall biosynthesis
VIDSDVGVVVRMYNEASRVGPVVSELREHFGLVVCVDDGSSDGSGAVAAAAGAIVIRHSQNLGGGAALETGFSYIRSRRDITWCLTFDADGQHRVEDALTMVQRARDSRVDVVLASRFSGSTTNMPRTRRLVLRLGTTFTRWTNHMDVSDAHNGLRVFRRSALLKFQVNHAGMAYASELMAAIREHGFTWTEVPVTILYDEYSLAKGQSSLNAINIVYDLTMARLRTH